MSNQVLEQILAQAKIDREVEKAAAEKAKAEKVAADAIKKAENDEKKAARDAKKAERAAKKAEKMPEANGIRRPRAETLCGQVWAVVDALMLSLTRLPTLKEVLDASIAGNAAVNHNNVRGEFVRYKKFHGLI